MAEQPDIVVTVKGNRSTVVSAPSGTATRLVELSDVLASPKANGDVLTYIAANGKFEFHAAVGGGGSGITLLTAQTPVSTNVATFTVPSGVKRITVMWSGISSNSSSSMILRIGPNAGVEKTGYLGAAGSITGTPSSENQTVGFPVGNNLDLNRVSHGMAVLGLLDSANNTWAMFTAIGMSNAAAAGGGGGSKSIAGVLGKVQLTWATDSTQFDAGQVNVMYE